MVHTKQLYNCAQPTQESLQVVKIMVGMIIVELLHPDLKYVHFRILKMDIKKTPNCVTFAPPKKNTTTR